MKNIKKQIGLIIQLTISNLKLKNENSHLGIFWHILNPLITFSIFLIAKDIVGKGVPNYPVYLFLGLIMFHFFRRATIDSINIIEDNSGLIKSTTTIDYKILVISSFFMSVFAHIFEMIVFMFFLVYFGVSITNIIFYPLIFIFLGFFVLGISFIGATIGVYIKDFKEIWMLFTRLLWFATPIFYSSKIQLPFKFNIFNFNPLYYFINIGREMIIYERYPELWMIIGAVMLSLFFLILGFFIFERYKNKFAEEI